MISIKDVLNKIDSIERELGMYCDTSDNIITIEFYTDEGGSIHSSECSFFEFNRLSDLKEFMKLSNKYIIENRKYYPL